MKPAILIAYGSDAITNGFKRVFGSEFKRVMCWAHMRRAVDKKIKMINDISIENEVMEDIEKIQILQNPKIFEKASQLFLNKWQLKATNNVIKDGDTFRESLALPNFLVVATNIVLNWSRRRDPTSENNKAFKTKTTISNTQWKAVYEWARLNKPIIKVKCEYCELLDDCSNTTHYYVSASDQASITNNDVNE